MEYSALTQYPASMSKILGNLLRNALALLLLSHVTSGATISREDSLGAVASESKICSEIGIGLLQRGVSRGVPTQEME